MPSPAHRGAFIPLRCLGNISIPEFCMPDIDSTTTASAERSDQNTARAGHGTPEDVCAVAVAATALSIIASVLAADER